MSTELTRNIQLRDPTSKCGKLVKEVTELPMDDALKLVVSGEAELSIDQVSPPFEVLKEVNDLVGYIEILGPVVTKNKTFGHITNIIFSHGLRQTMAEGQTLRWTSGLEELVKIVEMRLCASSIVDSNVIAQLNAVCAFHVTNALKVSSTSKLSLAYMKQNNLVPHPQNPYFLDLEKWDYHKLESEWHEFYCALEALNNDVSKTLEQAIVDGRIIVGEDTSNGSRFISPELVPDIFAEKTEGHYFFLLTQDLPISWFQDEETLGDKKSRATRWLERACRFIAPTGKRWSGTDAQIVLKEKFELSPNAAKDVWREANLPNRGKGGNIALDEKADIRELRKFK